MERKSEIFSVTTLPLVRIFTLPNKVGHDKRLQFSVRVKFRKCRLQVQKITIFGPRYVD